MKGYTPEKPNGKAAESPKNGRELLEIFDLRAGDVVTWRKIKSSDTSAVENGSVSTGILAADIQMGQPITLENDATTTAVQAVKTNEVGNLLILTATDSVYEIIREGDIFEREPAAEISMADYDAAVSEFAGKEYGEWDRFTGKVLEEDDPTYQVIKKAGWQLGDRITFFAEGERQGIIAKAMGEIMIQDENGYPWGFAAVLEGGPIRRN